MVVVSSGPFSCLHSLRLIIIALAQILDGKDCDQEPITRSEKLPCPRVTEFLRTSLFLVRFLARILNIFSISQTSPQIKRTDLKMIFFAF